MAIPAWQISAYDAFLLAKTDSSGGYNGRRNNGRTRDHVSSDQELFEVSYDDHDRKLPSETSLKLGDYSDEDEMHNIRPRVFISRGIPHENLEEVTSFSNRVSSVTNPADISDKEKVASFEEVEKRSLSDVPNHNSLHNKTDTILISKSLNQEILITSGGLTRSDTAPQLKSSEGNDSFSRKSSLSVSGDRYSRLDPHTYQSYAAGILHSSGRSDKFLQLQNHFVTLESSSEPHKQESKTKETDLPKLQDQLPKYTFENSEEISATGEMSKSYTGMKEERKRTETLFSTGDKMTRSQLDDDKVEGLGQRLHKYQEALKISEEPVQSSQKPKSFADSDMKRAVSFGELYSRYDGSSSTKKDSQKSLEHGSTLTSMGNLPVQESYIQIMDRAARQAKQVSIYGTNIGFSENVYDRHVKIKVNNLKLAYDTPPLKASSSPDIFQSADERYQSAPITISRTKNYFENAKSTPNLSLGKQNKKPHDSAAVDKYDEAEDGQCLSSSQDPLSSYNEARRKNLPTSRIQSYSSTTSSFVSSGDIKQLNDKSLAKNASLSTDTTVTAVTNPYEVRVHDLKARKNSSEDADGLHIRSESVPHANSTSQKASTLGSLQRTSSSKDTFFNAKFHMKDDDIVLGKTETVTEDTKNVQTSKVAAPASLPTEKIRFDREYNKSSDKMKIMEPAFKNNDYTMFQSGTNVILRDNTHNIKNSPLSHALYRAKSEASLEGTQCRPMPNSKHTKESTKPRQASQNERAEKGSLRGQQSSVQPSVQSLSANSRGASTQDNENALRVFSRRPRLFGERSDNSGSPTNPATTSFSSRNISQYEDLIARARKERMARKGYLHSYVNDPVSPGVQLYTSVTDTDYKFRNAYPFELKTSSGGETTELPGNAGEKMLQEHRSYITTTSPDLEDPFSPKPSNKTDRGDNISDISSFNHQDFQGALHKSDTTRFDHSLASIVKDKKNEMSAVAFVKPSYRMKQEEPTKSVNAPIIGIKQTGNHHANHLKNERENITRSLGGSNLNSRLMIENMPDIVQNESKVLPRKHSTDSLLRESEEGPTVYNADTVSKMSIHNQQGLKTKSPVSTFKVADLRGLAKNNEFAVSIFPRMSIPESAVSTNISTSGTHQLATRPETFSYLTSVPDLKVPPKPMPRKSSCSNSLSSDIFTFDTHVPIPSGVKHKAAYFENSQTNTVSPSKGDLGNDQVPAAGKLAKSPGESEHKDEGQHVQLRKWAGVLDIHQHELDSSPSPTYSSDGSAGTFIINHSEDDKNWSIDSRPASSYRHPSSSDHTNNKNSDYTREDLSLGNKKIPQISYKEIKGDGYKSKSGTTNTYSLSKMGIGFQTENKQKFQQLSSRDVNEEARITDRISVHPHRQRSARPKHSVMQLKNLFEPYGQSSETALPRTKSAPDLSKPLLQPNDTNATTTKSGLIRTLSGNLPNVQRHLQGTDKNDNVKTNSLKYTPSNKQNSISLPRPFYKSDSSLPNAVSEETGELLRRPSIPQAAPRTRYDPYIPPDDIVKEVEGFKEGRKYLVPRKKHHSPSVIGKMTLEYFDHIGSEWQAENVGKSRNTGGDNRYSHLEINDSVIGRNRAENRDFESRTRVVENSRGSYQTDDMKLRQERGKDLTDMNKTYTLSHGNVSQSQKFLSKSQESIPHSYENGSTIGKMAGFTQTRQVRNSDSSQNYHTSYAYEGNVSHINTNSTLPQPHKSGLYNKIKNNSPQEVSGNFPGRVYQSTDQQPRAGNELTQISRPDIIAQTSTAHRRNIPGKSHMISSWVQEQGMFKL